jgi:hypothetical protein
LTPDNACGAILLEAEAVTIEDTIETQVQCSADSPSPVAIYIVLDNSGSMEDNGKWDDAVDAISEFVRTDPSTGSSWTCSDMDGNVVAAPANLPPPGAGSISVAIQYFHPQGAGRNVDECSGTSHSIPAVAMGPLPDNGDDIIDSLNDTGPDGNTPTVGALRGGVQFCNDYRQNEDASCVVVLVTDGQPNGCGLESGNRDSVDPDSAGMLTPIAADGLSDGIVTFTVGMDGVSTDGFELLDAIARAGGSDCTPGGAGNEACNVAAGGAQSLLDALNTIRETVQVTDTSTETVTTTRTDSRALPCEWTIPEPPPGETFDPNLVNVTITASGATQTLGNVAAAADCAVAAGGWYYDDPSGPSRILVCPETCSVIEDGSGARINVLLGCSTEPAIVR